MNIKRTLFWLSFAVIIILIIWGMIVAINKEGSLGKLGSPADISAEDQIIGNPDAKVTLLEYGDFQCPACVTYFGWIETIFEQASTSMRMVFRHFPLSQHKNAVLASAVAESAGIQGKFWDMYRMIYENQYDWAESTTAEAMFIGYATELGLNIEKFKADIKDPKILAKIESQRREGESIGVNSTPTFFINGKVITNPNSYAEFKKMVDDAISANQ